ncbi:MAG: glucosaminidase domain-containing protein [Tannerellaceae bacterium]|nr:glucosaminidase domain-containing protein [Tannerellaceae bacterium]
MMQMNKFAFPFFFVFMLSMVSDMKAEPQDKNPLFQRYAETYGDLAVMHQRKYRIPASITLAQGMLESGAGQSVLARKANNHFGIKCHEWTGERIYHDDDLRGECFRKYKTVDESFDDHSRFLTGRHYYTSLFLLKIDDYKAWARGLQQCGYATDKGYADKLIRLIEEYELYRYDTEKSSKQLSPKKKEAKPASRRPIPDAPETVERKTDMMNELVFVYALENDTYARIARELGFGVDELMKFNEAYGEDPSLEKGDIVYLEKKKKKASKPYYDHVVQSGESMYSIAQRYGIQIRSLYKINKKRPGYVPLVGDVLRLR